MARVLVVVLALVLATSMGAGRADAQIDPPPTDPSTSTPPTDPPDTDPPPTTPPPTDPPSTPPVQTTTIVPVTPTTPTAPTSSASPVTTGGGRGGERGPVPTAPRATPRPEGDGADDDPVDPAASDDGAGAPSPGSTAPRTATSRSGALDVVPSTVAIAPEVALIDVDAATSKAGPLVVVVGIAAAGLALVLRPNRRRATRQAPPSTDPVSLAGPATDRPATSVDPSATSVDPSETTSEGPGPQQ